MKRLTFIHGFLGAPSDWDALIEQLPDFACEAIALDAPLPNDSLCIGYSMGGRRLLQEGRTSIIISSHLGLENEEEKTKRKRWEDEVCDQINTLSAKDFVRTWYAQALFDTLKKDDTFLARRAMYDPAVLLRWMRDYSLATQIGDTVDYTSHFIYGKKDLKYAAHYCTKLPKQRVHSVDAGHAIHLENPKALAETVRMIYDNW